MLLDKQYWTSYDLDGAHFFADLGAKACKGIDACAGSEQNRGVAMVCGPISNGGFNGDILGNLKVLEAVINYLRISQDDFNIFDQTFFGEHAVRIAKETGHAKWNPVLNKELLEDFVRPILETGHVRRLYFIPGWEASEGACWEHDQAQELNIERVYLNLNLQAIIIPGGTCLRHQQAESLSIQRVYL